MQRQHIRLVSGGLDGSLNSQITKLVLGKHGYHDKQQTELSGVDGKPIETSSKVEWKILPVTPINDIDE